MNLVRRYCGGRWSDGFLRALAMRFCRASEDVKFPLFQSHRYHEMRCALHVGILFGAKYVNMLCEYLVFDIWSSVYGTSIVKEAIASSDFWFDIYLGSRLQDRGHARVGAGDLRSRAPCMRP